MSREETLWFYESRDWIKPHVIKPSTESWNFIIKNPWSQTINPNGEKQARHPHQTMPKDHPFRTPKKRQQSKATHKRKTKQVRHSSFWTNTILEEGCGTSEGGKNCGNVYYSGSLAPTPPRSAINHRGRDNGRSKPGFYQVKLSRRGGSGSVCLFISFSCIHFFLFSLIA